jgi:hypothetical protein
VSCELPKKAPELGPLPPGKRELESTPMPFDETETDGDDLPAQRRGGLVQLSKYHRQDLCYRNFCRDVQHGFYERVDKGRDADWDDQSEIYLSNGSTIARWIGVRNTYAVCTFDYWFMRSSRTVVSSGPIFPDPDTIGSQAPFYLGQAGNMAWMYYSDGSGARRYDCRRETYRMPTAGRYWIHFNNFRAEIDYVSHTQWAAVFPSRSSYVSNRPLFVHKVSKSFTLDD